MPSDLARSRTGHFEPGYQRRPIIRPVSQVHCSLATHDREETWALALSEILKWLSIKASGPLPEEAWQGRSFDVEQIGAQPTAAVRLTPRREIDYWAAKNEDADSDVPNRSWITEIGLARINRQIRFGARLTCVTRGFDSPFTPSVPGLVRKLAKTVGLMDYGQPILDAPRYIEDRSSAENLAQLLQDKRRTRPVFAISSLETGTLINATYLAGQCCGVGHVAVLSSAASSALTDLLGREYSVFRGAVRTYRGGFDPEEDQPSDHPVCRAERIRDWPNGGPVSFAGLLVAEAIRGTVARPDLERDLPSFSTVRQVWLEDEQKKTHGNGATATSEVEIANRRIEELQARLEEQKSTFDGLLEEADRDLRQIDTERNEIGEQQRALRTRVEHLQAALESRQAPETRPPSSFEQIDDWATKILAGRVVLLNRAKRALKKAKFEDVGLVYKSLLLLHDYYVPMRIRGGAAQREAFEQRRQDLGLSEEPCFAGPGAGEQGDAYFVAYKGCRREVDRHLKRGNSHDERHCLRIYFFWDEEDQQVVIGWLPSHLPTRQT